MRQDVGAISLALDARKLKEVLIMKFLVKARKLENCNSDRCGIKIVNNSGGGCGIKVVIPKPF